MTSRFALPPPPQTLLAQAIRQASVSLTIGVFIGSALTSGIAVGVIGALLANERLLRRLRTRAVELVSVARDAALSTREGQALQRALLSGADALPTDSRATTVDLSVLENKPRVYAIRHAQSVANVAKEADQAAYFKAGWLDDAHLLPREKMLRDARLTPAGMRATLERAPQLAAESLVAAPAADAQQTKLLLVVSPLTRTILTAVLGFSQLPDLSRVTVVLEPAALEVINTPHDLIENVGRPMETVFAECHELLSDLAAPPGATALLAKLEAASGALPHDWWRARSAPGTLPRRVFTSEARERREALVAATARHVLRCNERVGERVGEVWIVCHWGVVMTLKRTCDQPIQCANLARFEIDDFWDA